MNTSFHYWPCQTRLFSSPPGYAEPKKQCVQADDDVMGYVAIRRTCDGCKSSRQRDVSLSWRKPFGCLEVSSVVTLGVSNSNPGVRLRPVAGIGLSRPRDDEVESRYRCALLSQCERSWSSSCARESRATEVLFPTLDDLGDIGGELPSVRFAIILRR